MFSFVLIWIWTKGVLGRLQDWTMIVAWSISVWWLVVRIQGVIFLRMRRVRLVEVGIVMFFGINRIVTTRVVVQWSMALIIPLVLTIAVVHVFN